jgi:hypothetical protein
MKIVMRTFATALICVIAITAFGYYFLLVPRPAGVTARETVVKNNKATVAKMRTARTRLKAEEAEAFVKSHGYNSNYCFLVDMSIPSGEWRFFIYNFKTEEVEHSGLVAHGSGSGKGDNELHFSNVPGSLATSVGRYKIGNSYTGSFGLAYKLYGLDNTNNKAYERCVVLHAHDCVPEGEIAPDRLCLSWGCPTVAPVFLRTLQEYIDRSAKPVLLWIYN